MRLVIAGVGRAGGALAIAAAAAGHEIAGLFSRSARVDDWLPDLVQSYDALTAKHPLPSADLLVIATRDVAIPTVAAALLPFVTPIASAVHMSGYSGVEALDPLAKAGIATGSFHPLQSLPDPRRGADAMSGAWVAITAEEGLRNALTELAASLMMKPFSLSDEHKPAYHAGAAAASNYVVAALNLAKSLFDAAGVPFEALEPLTQAAVRNAFNLTPRSALTGPIARGDWDTVAGQMKAADLVGPEVARQFRLLAEATAITAGRELPEDLR